MRYVLTAVFLGCYLGSTTRESSLLIPLRSILESETQWIADKTLAQLRCSQFLTHVGAFHSLDWWAQFEFDPANYSNTEYTCKFTPDSMKYCEVYQPHPCNVTMMQMTDVSWYCEMTPAPNDAETLCDGFSMCLTDECHCPNSSTFYCKDNSGCISFGQLCDGFNDCSDGSDECLCEGYVEVLCAQPVPQLICVSPMDFCLNDSFIEYIIDSLDCTFSQASPNCTEALIRHSEKEKIWQTPLLQCLFKSHEDFLFYYNRSDAYIVAEYCKINCSSEQDFDEGGWERFCDHIYLGETSLSMETYYWDFIFNCEPEPYATIPHAIHISLLCDGKKDCQNGADEAGCPDRFYCSPNSTIDWVSTEKLCDHVKDCSNGLDECGTCDMGGLSSSEFLIHNKIVLVSAGFAGLLMVALNVYVGVGCYRTEPSSTAGKIDRILRLQVCFFDGLMGVYNVSIVVASLVFRFKGAYCLFDQSWRSSVYCAGLGALFSVSAHGSLVTIALMSIVRCIICTTAYTEVKIPAVIVISALLQVMNLANSVVPILPISSIQEIFRTQAFFTNFKDIPFVNSGVVNISRLNELHQQYYSTTTDLYGTLANLNNITSYEGLFDVVEIGYYGNNRMCTHNLFKNQASYLLYKLFYFIVILVTLTIVAITYIIILCKKIKSNRRLRRMGAAENEAAADEISSMTMKIFLMIGTQLLSWLSLMIVAGYFQFTNKDPPPMTFEVFALVVIPVNSILNPIFYSGLYSQIKDFLWNLLRRVVEKARKTKAGVAPSSMELQSMHNDTGQFN